MPWRACERCPTMPQTRAQPAVVGEKIQKRMGKPDVILSSCKLLLCMCSHGNMFEPIYGACERGPTMPQTRAQPAVVGEKIQKHMVSLWTWGDGCTWLCQCCQHHFVTARLRISMWDPWHLSSHGARIAHLQLKMVKHIVLQRGQIGCVEPTSCLGIRLDHPSKWWLDWCFFTIHLGTTTFDLIIAIFKVDVVDVQPQKFFS